MAAAARMHTPEEVGAPTSTLRISQTQRQALIDNLQLEITERARKLRAQYAFQAQSLRTRLEMRINRIPSSLRKRNLQEFLDEHTQKSKPAPAPRVQVAPQRPAPKAAPARQQSLKRKSEIAGEDKENVAASTMALDLENPKKRAKTTQANSKAVRSHTATSNGVLSPKSHNSRPNLSSPSKPSTTMEKLGLSRPASPIKALKKAISKPMLQATAKQQTKRAAKEESRSSGGSDTSNATTIIKRTNSKKATTTTRKPAVPKTTATTRKPAAVKKEASATSSGRTLRKRG